MCRPKNFSTIFLFFLLENITKLSILDTLLKTKTRKDANDPKMESRMEGWGGDVVQEGCVDARR